MKLKNPLITGEGAGISQLRQVMFIREKCHHLPQNERLNTSFWCNDTLKMWSGILSISE